MSRQEKTHFWHNYALGESFEALKATYITHAFARHTHEGFAIGVIEKGAETFYYRGGMHLAPAGSVVVINPGELHTGQAVTDEGWAYRMIYPDAELLRRAAADIAGHPVQIPYFAAPVISDSLVFERLRWAHLMLELSPSRLEQESYLLSALTLLIQRHADVRLSPPALNNAHDSLERAQGYIQAHYAEDISLDALAQQVFLSPYHLSRLFRDYTGLPPHAYLNQIRVSRAKDLLNRGMPIVEVAQATGFADQAHLTKAFKRIVGVAPGQYRKIRQDLNSE